MTREIRFKTPALHQKQRLIKSQAQRFNVVDAGRRFGKNILDADLAIEPMLDGFPVGWFEPTYKSLADQWREISSAVAPITKRVNKDEHRIELITGGVLDMWSLDNPESGRGRKYKRVIVNEAAFIRELQYAWEKTIRATLIDLRGDAFIGGTPKGLNYFYQLYQEAEYKKDWAHFKFSSYDNPFIPPEEIDDMVANYPQRVVQQEIFAEFLEDGGFFMNVHACATVLKPDNPDDHRGHYLVMGADWAKSDDYTVITVGCRDCARIVDWWRTGDADYINQRARLKLMAGEDMWDVVAVLPERNSIGEPNIELLLDEGVRVINGPDKKPGFYTTGTSKPMLIQNLALGLERGAIAIPKDYLDELTAYTIDVTEGGHSTFSAPPGCFTANTPIQLADGGTIPISEVQSGDTVITHIGEAHAVYKTMKRHYEGKILRIKASGLPYEIEATPEHPFWARERTCKYLQKLSTRKEFPSKWIPACNLKAGDWLSVPKRKGLPKTNLSDEQLYAIGFWLAEGNLVKGWKRDVRGIALTNTDPALVDRASGVLSSWFEDDYVKRGNNKAMRLERVDSNQTLTTRTREDAKPATEWVLYSRPAGDYFKEFSNVDADGYSQHGMKHIRADLFNQSGTLPLVSGFIDGDGSQRSDAQRDVNIYTVSETLAWQLRQILIDNNIWCTLNQTIRKPFYSKRLNQDIKNPLPIWVINIKASFLHLLPKCKVEVPDQRHLRHVMEDDDYFYTPIRVIQEIDYSGDVFNFSVEEDNSYVAGGVAVHNCHDDRVMSLALCYYAMTKGAFGSASQWIDTLKAKNTAKLEEIYGVGQIPEAAIIKPANADRPLAALYKTGRRR